MSNVAERLRAFRYATSTREIPWTHLRSINIPSHRIGEPDLHLMKNLISLIADCNLSTAATPSTSLADIHQLLGVLQLTLQFTLWSQAILKEQLMEKQNGIAVKRINSQYIEGIELKLEASHRENIKLQEERDTFKITCQTLEQRLTQSETTIRCLKKELDFERKRLQELIPYLNKQKHNEKLIPASELQTSSAGISPVVLLTHSQNKISKKRQHERHSHSELWDKRNSENTSSCSSSNISELVKSSKRNYKNKKSNEMKELLQLLRQEREELKKQKEEQEQEQEQEQEKKNKQEELPLTTAIDNSIQKEKVEYSTDMMRLFCEEMKATQTQMTNSYETMRQSLESIVERSIQRTEEMIKRAEKSVEEFQSSLSRDQEKELEKCKIFFTNWQTEAQVKLEEELSKMINRLKLESTQEKQQLQIEQQQQQVPLPASFPPLSVNNSTSSKELTCQHCGQPFPSSILNTHESECELRFVKCVQCGQSVISRLLAKHKCNNYNNNNNNRISNGSGSPESTSLVRASSLMLQQTQRELQMLLQEEEEREEKEKEKEEKKSESEREREDSYRSLSP